MINYLCKHIFRELQLLKRDIKLAESTLDKQDDVITEIKVCVCVCVCVCVNQKGGENSLVAVMFFDISQTLDIPFLCLDGLAGNIIFFLNSSYRALIYRINGHPQ